MYARTFSNAKEAFVHIISSSSFVAMTLNGERDTFADVEEVC